jgi:CRP/FNR family transcriptional regulator
VIVSRALVSRAAPPLAVPREAGIVLPLSPHKRLRRQVHRGERLYRSGDPLLFLHVVHLGVFRCSAGPDEYAMQVIGFPMPGDVLGLDGIDTGRHASEVSALEDGEVFAFSMAQCRQWRQESAQGQRLMARAMSCEMLRAQEHMILLGTMRATARLSIFLLDQAERHGRLGFSRLQLVLRMSRIDIASYLGLTIETVSRSLARLQEEGAIAVEGRLIALLDSAALWKQSGLSPDTPRAPRVAIVDAEGELMSCRAGT